MFLFVVKGKANNSTISKRTNQSVLRTDDIVIGLPPSSILADNNNATIPNTTIKANPQPDSSQIAAISIESI